MSRTKNTPIRTALRPASSLQANVRDGLGAVESGHKPYLADEVRSAFADSLELDEAMLAGREREHRWDYLLGHASSQHVIGLEPHSAKDDEVGRVIEKRKAALRQLEPHLKPGAKVHAWLWVSSGRVQFADTEKTRRRLDQHGIQFVGTQARAKHLPAASAGPAPKRTAGRRPR